MAGYRLSPVAARARRRPVRRLRWVPSRNLAQTIAVGTATETSVAQPVGTITDQIVAVGTATETGQAQGIIKSTAGRRAAQGGLAILFSQASLNQTIRVNPATETDQARAIAYPTSQVVAVGTAYEADTAPRVLWLGALATSGWAPRLSRHPYDTVSRWRVAWLPPTSVLEGLPFADPTMIAVDPVAPVWTMRHGLPITQQGALAVTLDGTPPKSLTGIPLTVAGRLACAQLPPDALNNEVPRLTNGCVAVSMVATFTQ